MHTDGNSLFVRWSFFSLAWPRSSKSIRSWPDTRSKLNCIPHTCARRVFFFSPEIDFVPFYHFHFCRAVSCLFIIHSVVLLCVRSSFWRAFQCTKYTLDTHTHTHTNNISAIVQANERRRRRKKEKQREKNCIHVMAYAMYGHCSLAIRLLLFYSSRRVFRTAFHAIPEIQK